LKRCAHELSQSTQIRDYRVDAHVLATRRKLCDTIDERGMGGVFKVQRSLSNQQAGQLSASVFVVPISSNEKTY
jgi:hypothetical protein